MIARPPSPPPARDSLGWSLMTHACLFAAMWLLPKLSWNPAPPFEIEITDPYLGDGPAKLGAPKAFVPGVPERINRTPDVPVPPKPVEKAPEPPKDWTLPGPSTKVVETQEPVAPTPGGAVGGTGTAAKTGGSGEGSDDGVPGGTGHGGTPLKEMPRLLNLAEVLAGMRRLYPESERQAGREGAVIIVIHLNTDGQVTSSDIARPASPAFDEAAKKVGALMRFSPAIGLNGKPVHVRMPQEVRFRLTD
ncbi:MAG: TonB family protein [Elusimicrobiota bacterium]|nr:MAG: TonB family protein [Elusimicrobiota bacterium]